MGLELDVLWGMVLPLREAAFLGCLQGVNEDSSCHLSQTSDIPQHGLTSGIIVTPWQPSSDTSCTAAPWHAQLRDSQGTVSQLSASPTARLPAVWCSAPQISGSSAAPNSDFCLLSLVGHCALLHL